MEIYSFCWQQEVEVHLNEQQQAVMQRTNSPAFPTCHLFEVLEPNLMELNLSELTLTLFNRICCSKQLGYHGT
jgi:hypothetical protein